MFLLRCAFKNTPKYNQVKGKGIIVKKDWITACYNEQKKLLCQNFALDKHDKNNKYDNDPEIHDIKLKPPVEKLETTIPSAEIIKVAEEITLIKDNAEDVNMSCDESDDTEDEIERVLNNNNNKIKEKINISPSYDRSTDEDESVKHTSSAKVIEKYFFNNKKFYINENNISTIDLIKLKRFIPLYKGYVIKELK